MSDAQRLNPDWTRVCWEYMALSLDDSTPRWVEALNKLGSQGWELAGVRSSDAVRVAILKRQLRPTPTVNPRDPFKEAYEEGAQILNSFRK